MSSIASTSALSTAKQSTICLAERIHRQRIRQSLLNLTVNSKPDLSLAESLTFGAAHLGHKRMSPFFAPFALGKRAGITVINPEATITNLDAACKFLKSLVANDGIVLFLAGGQLKNQDIFKDDMPQNCYLNYRWVPGTLTNKYQLFSDPTKTVKTFGLDGRQPLLGPDGMPKPAPNRYEQNKNSAKIPPKPDLIITSDVVKHNTAIKEATRCYVPTMAIIDSDIDPRMVSYPIPANDNNFVAIDIIMKQLLRAATEGWEERSLARKAR